MSICDSGNSSSTKKSMIASMSVYIRAMIPAKEPTVRDDFRRTSMFGLGNYMQ